MIHNLKTLQPYFYEVEQGIKNFELRKNDRDFKVGDSLCLQEFDGNNLTGKWIVRKIIYMLDDKIDFGLKPGYVILGIK